MTGLLPEFPYHPDPLVTGFVEESEATCLSCNRGRGFIYTGPVYAADGVAESICPWCIARVLHGKTAAARRFVAVPIELMQEVAASTLRATGHPKGLCSPASPRTRPRMRCGRPARTLGLRTSTRTTGGTGRRG